MPAPSDDERRSKPSTDNTSGETYRKYIKFKSKEIKKAKQNGNHGKARRHVVELMQQLDMNKSSEPPIEDVLEPLE